MRYISCCSLHQDGLTGSIVAMLLQSAHIANSVAHG